MNSASQTKDFANFCNSFGAGFLKEHKAAQMLATLTDIPEIMSDNIRLLTFLENSLVMEGFNAVSLENIQRWLIDNFE